MKTTIRTRRPAKEGSIEHAIRRASLIALLGVTAEQHATASVTPCRCECCSLLRRRALATT